MNPNQAIFRSQVLKDLNSCWTPHDGQVPIGEAVFYQDKTLIFNECGRKFGKTEILCYFLYRLAMMVSNGAFYYIAPFSKQARELVWEAKRFQNFLNEEIKEKYQIRFLDQQMRVRIGSTGSFIKLDGAENFEAYRGVNPHGIGYDEFKDFRPQFHEAMDPNLATHNAPLMIIGTPPRGDDLNKEQFIQLADYCKEDEQAGYFNLPTETNPHISKDWLDKKKQELFLRGEHDVWFREYMAQRVTGGKRAIYPMFSRNKMVSPHGDIISHISRYRKRLTFQCIADPASTSVFGVLFRAIDPGSKTIYRIDEIYEDIPEQMTGRKMWDKIYKKITQIHPHLHDWHFVYDEAAAWFANEMHDILMDEGLHNEMCWVPTNKLKGNQANKKETGINLIREQMLYGKYVVSDRCQKLMWEIENYIKDDKGKIPKENDHLLDCDRYGDMDYGYNLNREEIPEDEKPKRRLEDELDRMSNQDNWDLDYEELY